MKKASKCRRLLIYHDKAAGTTFLGPCGRKNSRHKLWPLYREKTAQEIKACDNELGKLVKEMFKTL
ncbi:MAG TPA: hypothetical protein VNY73_03735 [Bacteroidia bacterium]|jgi:hypothetical protein|nr:hypothetical protein [Bacteroidia bacterium]